MSIFTFEETRQFSPGAMGEAYIPLTLLPLHDVRGTGSRVFSQLSTFSRQLTQAPGAAQAWNGEISGQFVLQPLVDDNSGGPGA